MIGFMFSATEIWRKLMSWIIDIIVDFSMEHNIWNRAYIYSREQKPIYKFGLSVCLLVSNKHQNGWTDQAQFFVGSRATPG